MRSKRGERVRGCEGKPDTELDYTGVIETATTKGEPNRDLKTLSGQLGYSLPIQYARGGIGGRQLLAIGNLTLRRPSRSTRRTRLLTVLGDLQSPHLFDCRAIARLLGAHLACELRTLQLRRLRVPLEGRLRLWLIRAVVHGVGYLLQYSKRFRLDGR